VNRVVAIVNTAAGGGRAPHKAEPYLAQIPGVVVRPTEHPGHATAIARECKEDGVDAVVAVGGDGTLFEVVNGLLPGPGPSLGILPLGTGNSFVRDVGLADADAGVRAVLAGNTRSVDALKVEHTGGELFSINLVSLGFTAEAGELMNRRFKRLGATGYVSAVLTSLVNLKYHAFPYGLDDGPFDARPVTMVSFCNSRYTGGAMMMAPNADPSDGELDVVRIGTMRRRRFLASFPKIFRGTHPEMREVEQARARSVSFAPIGPVPVMVDGEVLTLDLRRVSVLRLALEIFAG
jgi:diacylglycerol kinase (ATP)